MKKTYTTKEHFYVEVVTDTTRNGNVKVAIWEYGKGQLKSTVAKVAKEMDQTAKIRITGNDANSYIGIRAYEGFQIDATGEYVFTDTTDFSNKNFGKIYKFANAKDAILKIATGNVEDNFIFTDENLIALAYLNDHPDAIDAAAEAEIELAAADDTAEVTTEVAAEVNDDIRKSVEAIAESGREYLETHLPCGVRRDKLAETLTAIHNDIMDAHDNIDVKIIDGAPKAEIEELAEHIAALDRRYSELYKVTYPDGFCETSTPDEVIADTVELLTIVDKDGNEISPAEFKAAEAKAAKVDEPEVTEVTETEITDDQRKVAEAVADSMTAAAPDDTWSVTFTGNGKFAVYSSDSVNVVDTITAGDFLNPKEFFEQFKRKPTADEFTDERKAALAELNYEREQLLTVRDELAREYPDEVERLKLLDEMIAENDADITALETFKKPRDAVEFDDKGNVKAIWF